MSSDLKVKPIEVIGQLIKYFVIFYVLFVIILAIILILLYFWVVPLTAPEVLEIVTSALLNNLLPVLLILLVPAVIGSWFVAGSAAKNRKLEEQFRLNTQLLDIAPDSVFVHDMDGNCIYANDMSSKSRGYSKEELMRINRSALNSPEHEEIFRSRINEALERGEVTFESVHLRKDKSPMPVEINSRVVKSNRRKFILSVVRDITERKQTEEEIRQNAAKLRRAMEGTIQAIVLTTEMKDPYTSGHQQRVAKLASAIASELGLSQDQIEGIRVAGSLHDIGKISVPSEILSKPGRLKSTEFNLIKDHAQVGYDILKTVDFPWPVAQIVIQHHERLDGSGYPQGLKDAEIRLEAAIMAVADVVESMASHRPYRPAFSIEKALLEIMQKKGVLYHPEVVDACVKLFNDKGFTF